MELKQELEDLLKRNVKIDSLQKTTCMFTTQYLLFTYDKEYNSFDFRLKEYHDRIPIWVFRKDDYGINDNFQDFQSVYLEVQDIYTKKGDIIKILDRYLKG